MTTAPPVRLMNRHFFLLWQGQLVSQLGNQAFLIAMMFWMMKATGSASLMGFVMMVSLIPTLLLGPVGGAVADRHSRRRIIIFSDVVRGVSVLALAALMLWSPESTSLIVAALFAVAILGGIVTALFQPAIMAAIPDLVPKEKVAAANSLSQISTQGSMFLGQAVGGILFRLLGAPVLFFIDGITYLFSAVSECFIAIPQTIPEKKETMGEAFSAYLSEALDGLRYVWERRGLRTFLLATSGINFLFMPMFVLLPFYVEGQLAREAEWYGFLLAAIGAGSLVGFAVAGAAKLTGRTRPPVLIGALFATSIILTFLGQVRTPLLALVLFFLTGVMTGLINIFVLTLLQVSTPGEMRGRVMALTITISGAAAPLGMALGGILGDATGKNIPLLYTVFGSAAVVLTALVSMSPRFREFLAEEAEPEATEIEVAR